MTNLGIKKTIRKTGTERFTISGQETDFSLLQYWRWSASDVLGNTARGVLAEYIVATALGIADGVRDEWAPYDLISPNGIKIEVKSAAYLQSWHQKKYSVITFGIQESHAWNPQTNKRSQELKRQSDVYVFCLLAHKDKATIDPLNLDQWRFFVLPRQVLDDKLGNQKTLGLNSLLKLNPVETAHDGIREAVEACRQ